VFNLNSMLLHSFVTFITDIVDMVAFENVLFDGSVFCDVSCGSFTTYKSVAFFGFLSNIASLCRCTLYYFSIAS
jgi:hypothetical protein